MDSNASDPRALAHDLRHLLTLAELEWELCSPQEARAVLSRLRARCEAELEPQRALALDLAQLVREEVSKAEQLCQGRLLELRVAELPLAAHAEGAWRRLVRNLVLNALEASPRGAKVCVRLEATGGGARLVIEDQGAGLTREEVERCLGGGLSRSGGHGVGTASVAECARALRATVLVESGPGLGTTIIVTPGDTAP